MIYQTLRLLVLAFVGLVMSACGGGGGGNTTTTLSTNCQTSPAGLFYEVTQQSGCTSIAQNNLISTVDLSTSYAVSDGGGSGGDGGGSGSGGDGGGAGAGDIWLRISQYFKSAAYALLGVTNAHAQAVTSCGVSQNDLYKLTSSGWVYQPLVKAGTVADGSLGRLYYFAPRSINGGPYNIVFSYVNLGSGALSDSVFSINRPASIQCGSPAVSADADLHEASLTLLEDQSKFVIAARTQASFSQTGAIASGGLSTVVMVDRSNPSNRQEVIPFSACTVVRKFEQASSGNYGLVTEPYGAGLSPSLVQTTSIRDQNFVSRHEQFGAAGEQKFKIGARLNPL